MTARLLEFPRRPSAPRRLYWTPGAATDPEKVRKIRPEREELPDPDTRPPAPPAEE